MLINSCVHDILNSITLAYLLRNSCNICCYDVPYSLLISVDDYVISFLISTDVYMLHINTPPIIMLRFKKEKVNCYVGLSVGRSNGFRRLSSILFITESSYLICRFVMTSWWLLLNLVTQIIGQGHRDRECQNGVRWLSWKFLIIKSSHVGWLWQIDDRY